MAKAKSASKGRHAVSTKVASKWFYCDVALWRCGVFLFVGSPEEMHSSLVSKDGLPAEMGGDEIDYAKSFLEKHHKHTAGDAFGNGDFTFIRLAEMNICCLQHIAVLSHECLHAANAILRTVGLMGDDNVEGMAYTQEFIFEAFMKKCMESVGWAAEKADGRD